MFSDQLCISLPSYPTAIMKYENLQKSRDIERGSCETKANTAPDTSAQLLTRQLCDLRDSKQPREIGWLAVLASSH